MGRSVEDWLASDEQDEWSQMMRRRDGHDMGYRIALTVEELSELAAAVTKGKPLEECVEEMADILILLMGHSLAMEVDLKSAFGAKLISVWQF